MNHLLRFHNVCSLHVCMAHCHWKHLSAMPMRKGIHFDFLSFGRKRVHGEWVCVRTRIPALFHPLCYICITPHQCLCVICSIVIFGFFDFFLPFVASILFLFFFVAVIIIVMVLKWSALFRSNFSRCNCIVVGIQINFTLKLVKWFGSSKYVSCTVFLCGRPRQISSEEDATEIGEAIFFFGRAKFSLLKQCSKM